MPRDRLVLLRARPVGGARGPSLRPFRFSPEMQAFLEETAEAVAGLPD